MDTNTIIKRQASHFILSFSEAKVTSTKVFQPKQLRIKVIRLGKTFISEPVPVPVPFSPTLRCELTGTGIWHPPFSVKIFEGRHQMASVELQNINSNGKTELLAVGQINLSDHSMSTEPIILNLLPTKKSKISAAIVSISISGEDSTEIQELVPKEDSTVTKDVSNFVSHLNHQQITGIMISQGGGNLSFEIVDLDSSIEDQVVESDRCKKLKSSSSSHLSESTLPLQSTDSGLPCECGTLKKSSEILDVDTSTEDQIDESDLYDKVLTNLPASHQSGSTISSQSTDSVLSCDCGSQKLSSDIVNCDTSVEDQVVESDLYDMVQTNLPNSHHSESTLSLPRNELVFTDIQRALALSSKIVDCDTSEEDQVVNSVLFDKVYLTHPNSYQSESTRSSLTTESVLPNIRGALTLSSEIVDVDMPIEDKIITLQTKDSVLPDDIGIFKLSSGIVDLDSSVEDQVMESNLLDREYIRDQTYLPNSHHCSSAKSLQTKNSVLLDDIGAFKLSSWIMDLDSSVEDQVMESNLLDRGKINLPVPHQSESTMLESGADWISHKISGQNVKDNKEQRTSSEIQHKVYTKSMPTLQWALEIPTYAGIYTVSPHPSNVPLTLDYIGNFEMSQKTEEFDLPDEAQNMKTDLGISITSPPIIETEIGENLDNEILDIDLLHQVLTKESIPLADSEFLEMLKKIEEVDFLEDQSVNVDLRISTTSPPIIEPGISNEDVTKTVDVDFTEDDDGIQEVRKNMVEVDSMMDEDLGIFPASSPIIKPGISNEDVTKTVDVDLSKNDDGIQEVRKNMLEVNSMINEDLGVCAASSPIIKPGISDEDYTDTDVDLSENDNGIQEVTTNSVDSTLDEDLGVCKAFSPIIKPGISNEDVTDTDVDLSENYNGIQEVTTNSVDSTLDENLGVCEAFFPIIKPGISNEDVTKTVDVDFTENDDGIQEVTTNIVEVDSTLEDQAVTFSSIIIKPGINNDMNIKTMDVDLSENDDGIQEVRTNIVEVCSPVEDQFENVHLGICTTSKKCIKQLVDPTESEDEENFAPIISQGMRTQSFRLSANSKSNLETEVLNWTIESLASYPEIKITNLSSSWRNGLGFCALIHSRHPQLIHLSCLRVQNPEINLELAVDAAQLLGVGGSLKAEHLGHKSDVVYFLKELQKVLKDDAPDVSSEAVSAFHLQWYQKCGFFSREISHYLGDSFVQEILNCDVIVTNEGNAMGKINSEITGTCNVIKKDLYEVTGTCETEMCHPDVTGTCETEMCHPDVTDTDVNSICQSARECNTEQERSVGLPPAQELARMKIVEEKLSKELNALEAILKDQNLAVQSRQITTDRKVQILLMMTSLDTRRDRINIQKQEKEVEREIEDIKTKLQRIQTDLPLTEAKRRLEKTLIEAVNKKAGLVQQLHNLEVALSDGKRIQETQTQPETITSKLKSFFKKN